MRRSRYVPPKPRSAEGVNTRILSYRSWCPAHHAYYPTNIRQANGHVVANDCPECTKETAWFNQAWAELRAEGQKEIWRSEVIARAEKLAGQQLRKYRYGK